MSIHGLEGLIEAAKLGEEWAWRCLYEDLAPQLLGYFRVRGSRSAEDLVGETFVQLARNLPNFDGEASSFRSWVFMIAHNRLSNERRWFARKPETLVPVAEGEHRTSSSAEDDALADLAGGDAMGLLTELTVNQRNVVALRYIADLSVEETAKILGVSAGAVKQAARRALRQLRREILEKAVTR